MDKQVQMENIQQTIFDSENIKQPILNNGKY